MQALLQEGQMDDNVRWLAQSIFFSEKRWCAYLGSVWLIGGIRYLKVKFLDKSNILQMLLQIIFM